MKTPRSEVWLRSVDRARKGIERVLATGQPRDAYAHILGAGPVTPFEEGDRGALSEAWSAAWRAAVIAQPTLAALARETVQRILIDRFPLAPPPAGSPASGPAGRIHLRVTADSLHFHLAWHNVLWTLLAGLPPTLPRQTRELAELPPPGERQGKADPTAWIAHEPPLPEAAELGDILYRFFLLDLAAPLFEALALLERLPDRLAGAAAILAGWIQTSALARLAHLDTLGAHPLLNADSWPGIAAILTVPVLDGPAIIARCLVDLEEHGIEPLAPQWLAILHELMRATFQADGGKGTSGAALWRLLLRSFALRGGIEEACNRLLSLGDAPDRIRPLLQLASVLNRSTETMKDWSATERQTLAWVASGCRARPAAKAKEVTS